MMWQKARYIRGSKIGHYCYVLIGKPRTVDEIQQDAIGTIISIKTLRTKPPKDINYYTTNQFWHETPVYSREDILELQGGPDAFQEEVDFVEFDTGLPISPTDSRITRVMEIYRKAQASTRGAYHLHPPQR